MFWFKDLDTQKDLLVIEVSTKTEKSKLLLKGRGTIYNELRRLFFKVFLFCRQPFGCLQMRAPKTRFKGRLQTRPRQIKCQH